MNDVQTASKPLTARAQANREKIYRAAVKLIGERGYDAITMSDIAEAAEVARASVFNHFPVKIAFLAEWYARFTHEILAVAREETSDSARVRLDFLYRALGAGAHANKPLIIHVASLAMGHGPLAATESELDDALRLYFLELITLGQATGEIRSELDADFLADFFVGVLTVTAHDWVNRGQVSDLYADLKRRFDTIFSGIEK